MYHKIWTVANVILVIFSIIYIWFFSPHDNILLVISQFLAQATLLLFIFNVNMYFIFLIIRKTKQREIKIRLATFSRYFMKWHIKIAVTATIFIIGHASVNFIKMGPLIGYENIKMILGYMTFLLLWMTLFAGYLRHKKATGFRKKFHRTTAFVLIIVLLIHMLAPI